MFHIQEPSFSCINGEMVSLHTKCVCACHKLRLMLLNDTIFSNCEILHYEIVNLHSTLLNININFFQEHFLKSLIHLHNLFVNLYFVA